MGKSIIELEKQRLEWSLKTFEEATASSALAKLKTEVNEIKADLEFGRRRPEEYADVLMCLFDSAGRQQEPITVQEIFDAFEKKLKVNLGRYWLKNPNNTYSHFEYPVIDGHRKHYARTPLLITEENKKHPVIKLTVGKYVAVDVLRGGYEHLIAPAEVDTEQECQRGCDSHNKYVGFTSAQLIEIFRQTTL